MSIVRTAFDGQTIAKVLTKHNYRPLGRVGSHLKLRWESTDTDEVRIVSVPIKSRDQIPRVTMEGIAEQFGAKDFRARCRWIDENS